MHHRHYRIEGMAVMLVCIMPRFDQYTDYEYPAEGASRIHMIWTDTPCWSTCWNGGNRLQDALRSEEIEFYLVQHPWMENDTLFGDIILPVSTKFEQHDIMTCDYDGVNNMVLDECQAVDPVGEARSDSECVLGGALLTERIMRRCISQDHGARVDSIVRGTGGLDRGGANNLVLI